MSRILVTGATGFLGRNLCSALCAAGHDVLAAARTLQDLADVDPLHIPDIGANTDWGSSLNDVQVVVHLAARVHVMKESANDPLAEFRRVNTEGTRRLAEAAAEAGVRRFIFISTIKVNGESNAGAAYCEDDPAAPRDAYGISKWEAEQALFQVASRTPMEAVVLRPPLIYGEGVKGNFLALLRLCRMSLPLPLGGIVNKRSMIYLGNMVDVIVRCLDHPAAAGQTFLVRDGEDLTVSDLIRRLAKALGKPALLFPVPEALLQMTGRLTGKSDMVARLLDSLTVDDRKVRQETGWVPPYTVTQGLDETAAWFLSQGRQRKDREKS